MGVLSLTIPVDVERRRQLFGSDAGQSTLLRGLLRHSVCCLSLTVSVAHPGVGRHKTGVTWACDFSYI